MKRGGFTLVELIMSMGLVVIIFGGAYAAYSSILDSVVNSELRTDATNVLNSQIEMMRNLPYASVGTIGGIPAGTVPQEQTITWGPESFVIDTYVRNIDDPFDGMPIDADYKLVEVTASCPICAHFVPLTITTTIAAKNLESATNNGSLFISTFNSGGQPIPGVTVHVVNNAVNPTINLTDMTNNFGQLQLVGVPTSTQNYHITVADNGYSSDQTYPVGGQGNPNPLNPDATVVASTLTTVSFAIDKVSTINVSSSDALCAPIGNQSFSLSGSKLIGTNPDVLKFSTSASTDVTGSANFQNIEWDTYNFYLNSPNFDPLGTIPLSPVIVNPNTNLNFRFVLTPSRPNSLLVAAEDSVSKDLVNNASVTLSKSGFSETFTTGHGFTSQADWSLNKYDSKSSDLDADSVPGQLSLLIGPSSTYPLTQEWLVSKTIDLGSASSSLYSLNWTPSTEPTQTGPNSVQFQIAANNDNATWNFTGPGGNPNAYYASSSSLAGPYDNNRYVRYKIFLQTADQNFTPIVQSVSLEFNGICVPPGQVLFNNLSADNYNLSVSASGYPLVTSTISVASGFQKSIILLSP